MFMLEVFTHTGRDPAHPSEKIHRYDEVGDQAVFMWLLKSYWNFEIRNHVKIVSPKLFNVYLHVEPQCDPYPGGIKRWEEGDLLVHTTGVQATTRHWHIAQVNAPWLTSLCCPACCYFRQRRLWF
jgi:hypothetical protein